MEMKEVSTALCLAPTALDQVSRLLRLEGFGDLCELHELINENSHVQATGLNLTYAQLRDYYFQVKRGLEYMSKEYGYDSMPIGYIAYGGCLDSGREKLTGWIAYLPENDVVAVSMKHLAGLAKRYQTSSKFLDRRLPGNGVVRAEDFTLLQTIEECYHRFQIGRLGMVNDNNYQDRNHPLEAGIAPVFSKAIHDLRIQTYPSSQIG